MEYSAKKATASGGYFGRVVMVASGTVKELRVLDLFCGCGGLSYGISLAELAGYKLKVVAGLDFNPASIETFKLNHPDAKSYCVDIRKTDIQEIVDEIGPIDIIVGGPSCQGFSTHGKRLADDPRNFLYKHYLEFVERIRPRWSLIENVTGLLRYQSGRFRDEIVSDLSKLGYAVSFAQLQAADYGVPQIRKRVFFVANRLQMSFLFPAPTHGPFQTDELPLNSGRTIYPFVTLAEAIGDLPLIGSGCTATEAPSEYALPPTCPFQQWARGRANALTMHFGAPPPPENLKRIRHIPPGGDWLDIPANLLPDRFAKILSKDCTTLFYRLRWDRPGYTITTVYRNVSSGAFTHPDEDRALTHREAARIQTFPDTFRFSDRTVPRQIGNAVPPLLARALGIALLVHEHASENSFATNEELEAAVNNEVYAAAVSSTGSIKIAKIHYRSRIQDINPDAALSQGWSLIGSQVDPKALWSYLDDLKFEKLFQIPTTGASIPLKAWRLLHALDRQKVNHLQTLESSADRLRYEAKMPTRRRLRAWTTHHFATVRYDIDPKTACSDMSKPLLLKMS